MISPKIDEREIWACWIYLEALCDTIASVQVNEIGCNLH